MSAPGPQPQAVGTMLRRHRKAAGLTQEDLADAAALSVRTLSDIERGLIRSPHKDTLRALADALHLADTDLSALHTAARRRLVALPAAAEAGLPPIEPPAAPPAPAAIQIFLIADMRGYTRYTVEQGDEAGAALAARFAALVRDVVVAREGQLLELRGDEALVVFSSPRQALRAAVAIQSRLQQEVAVDRELPLGVGIGLDAGEAVPVEGGYRGSALNLAARLCSLAGAGEVLASEGVIHLARKVGDLAYRERGHVQLKGFAEPVRVIQVVAEAAVYVAEAAEAAEAVAAGKEAQTNALAPSLAIGGFLGALPDVPLVARKVELAHVLDAITAVLDGAGRLLIVVGEPGVGKTRLAQEAMLAVRNRHFLVATGRCYEPQESVAYYPFLEALSKAYAASPPGLRAELPHRWPDLVRLLPGHFPGPAASSSPGSSGGDRDEQQRLFWQVTDFVQALAATQPVAVLLDDLHWADGASLALLAHLARHTHEYRVLLLATCREEELRRRKPLAVLLADLGREQLVERLPLPRLPVEGTAALIAATMGEVELSKEFVELLHRHTEGNAFFTQEVLRALVERGDIFQRDGRWGRRYISAISVPDSVRTVIEQRVGHLGEPIQEVLKDASVFGQVFAFEDLAGLGTHFEAEVEAALEEAGKAGLVREVGLEGYAFHHVLIRQALYEGLAARRRRRLHRLAGEALERLPERRREQRVAELAWHFREAGEDARALPYVLRAGDQAMVVFGYAEAEQQYRSALALAEALDDQPHIAEAMEKLGDLLELTARHEEARDVYQRLLDLTSASETDPLWLARLHCKLADSLLAQRLLNEAERALGEAQVALGPEPDAPTDEWWQTWLQYGLSLITLYYWRVRAADMLAFYEQLRPVIERFGTAHQRVGLVLSHMVTLARRDRYVFADEMIAETEAALAAAQNAGSMGDIAETTFGLAFMHVWRSELDEAEAGLHATLALAEHTPIGRFGNYRVLAFTYLTVVHRKRGNLEETRRYAEQALAAAEEQQMSPYVAMAHANLAWIAWRRGDDADAEAGCQAALDIWQQAQAPYMFEWAGRGPLIALHIANDRIGEAVDCARLLVQPSQLALPPALDALLAAAISAWDAGQPNAARERLAEAVALAQQTGYL